MSALNYYTGSGTSMQGQPSGMHFSDWSTNSAAGSADSIPNVPIAPPPVRYVQSSSTDPNATTLSMEHFKPSSKKEYMTNGNSPSEDDSESVTQKWWFPWVVGGGLLIVVAIIGGAIYKSNGTSNINDVDKLSSSLSGLPQEATAFGSSGILNDLEFL